MKWEETLRGDGYVFSLDGDGSQSLTFPQTHLGYTLNI